MGKHVAVCGRRRATTVRFDDRPRSPHGAAWSAEAPRAQVITANWEHMVGNIVAFLRTRYRRGDVGRFVRGCLDRRRAAETAAQHHRIEHRGGNRHSVGFRWCVARKRSGSGCVTLRRGLGSVLVDGGFGGLHDGGRCGGGSGGGGNALGSELAEPGGLARFGRLRPVCHVNLQNRAKV